MQGYLDKESNIYFKILYNSQECVRCIAAIKLNLWSQAFRTRFLLQVKMTLRKLKFNRTEMWPYQIQITHCILLFLILDEVNIAFVV